MHICPNCHEPCHCIAESSADCEHVDCPEDPEDAEQDFSDDEAQYNYED